jgi:hypothetical protein
MGMREKIVEILKSEKVGENDVPPGERLAFLVASLAFQFVKDDLTKNADLFIEAVRAAKNDIALDIRLDLNFLRHIVSDVLEISLIADEELEKRKQGAS